jgi:ATP-dependent DNA ligase
MLDYFAYLADRPDKADVRYVLALLLIRRRVIRLENTLVDAAGEETLVVVCPRDESESRLVAVMPDEPRIAEIQAELSKLLFGDAASIMPEGLTAEAPSPVGLPLDAGDAACTDA